MRCWKKIGGFTDIVPRYPGQADADLRRVFLIQTTKGGKQQAIYEYIKALPFIEQFTLHQQDIPVTEPRRKKK